jgi:hypothetical protein
MGSIFLAEFGIVPETAFSKAYKTWEVEFTNTKKPVKS